MEFKDDLIEGFVKSKNRQITQKKSYISGTGASVVSIYTSNGEKWVFVDFDHLEIYGVGARSDEYRRPAQTKNFFRDWQLYAIDKTRAFQRDTLLKKFIDHSRNCLDSSLEDLGEIDEIKKIESFGDDIIKHVLNLEEKRFAGFLATAKTEFDYKVVREGVLVNRAFYGKMIQDNLEYLLSHVPKGIDEKGEEVYNFSETQYAAFERLKNIGETIDFSLRYQLYRTDLKEDENQI